MKRLLWLFLALSVLPLRGENWTLDSRTQVVAPPEGKEAGQLLQEGLSRCLAGKSAGAAVRIELVCAPDAKLDPEGFRFSYPGPGTVRIIARNRFALRHGTCAFLERYLGVRWLFPDELGTVMPGHDTVELPGREVEENPVYRIRSLCFEESNQNEYLWAERNRSLFQYDFRKLPDRPWFQHNLWRLLPQEIYTKSHPEYFPILNGKRFLPEKGNNVWWQYCFTAPGIVEDFSAALEKSFRKTPGCYSHSIGVNDGARYCECPRCLAVDGDRKNLIGLADRTHTYFNCMNQVVKRCSAPGRTFGFLAYSALLEPPSGLKLEPGMVPFLTLERFYWADPVRMQADKTLTERWCRAAGTVGWYGALLCANYLIPKISLKLLPEALRWGAAHGVKHYYSEVYPAKDWSCGPMPWLLLRLTWDPAQSSDALLRDWCVSAVGKAAAPALAEYYRLCSEYWEKEVPKTPWFHQPGRQYLDFGSGGYMDGMTSSMLDRMKAAMLRMDKAASASGTTEEKARAKHLLKGFLDREPQARQFIANVQLKSRLKTLEFRELKHYDFNRPGLWPTWQRKTSQGKFLHAPHGGVDGSGALEIDPRESYKSMVYMKDVAVTPGGTYHVTAKVRTAGTDPDCRVGLRIAWSAPGQNWLNPASEVTEELGEDASFQWRTLSAAAKAPDVPGCRLRCILSMDGTQKGQIFFDEVVIREAVSKRK